MKKYVPKFISNKVEQRKADARRLLRKQAIKNIESECILRGIEPDDIEDDKLEILINNEQDRIIGKGKNNAIVALLILLGFNV